MRCRGQSLRTSADLMRFHELELMATTAVQHVAARRARLERRAGRRRAATDGAAQRLDAGVWQVELARELDDVVVHVCGSQKHRPGAAYRMHASAP